MQGFTTHGLPQATESFKSDADIINQCLAQQSGFQFRIASKLEATPPLLTIKCLHGMKEVAGDQFTECPCTVVAVKVAPESWYITHCEPRHTGHTMPAAGVERPPKKSKKRKSSNTPDRVQTANLPVKKRKKSSDTRIDARSSGVLQGRLAREAAGQLHGDLVLEEHSAVVYLPEFEHQPVASTSSSSTSALEVAPKKKKRKSTLVEQPIEQEALAKKLKKKSKHKGYAEDAGVDRDMKQGKSRKAEVIQISGSEPSHSATESDEDVMQITPEIRQKTNGIYTNSLKGKGRSKRIGSESVSEEMEVEIFNHDHKINEREEEEIDELAETPPPPLKLPAFSIAESKTKFKDTSTPRGSDSPQKFHASGAQELTKQAQRDVNSPKTASQSSLPPSQSSSTVKVPAHNLSYPEITTSMPAYRNLTALPPQDLRNSTAKRTYLPNPSFAGTNRSTESKDTQPVTPAVPSDTSVFQALPTKRAVQNPSQKASPAPNVNNQSASGTSRPVPAKTGLPPKPDASTTVRPPPRTNGTIHPLPSKPANDRNAPSSHRSTTQSQTPSIFQRGPHLADLYAKELSQAGELQHAPAPGSLVEYEGCSLRVAEVDRIKRRLYFVDGKQ